MGIGINHYGKIYCVLFYGKHDNMTLIPSNSTREKYVKFFQVEQSGSIVKQLPNLYKPARFKNSSFLETRS